MPSEIHREEFLHLAGLDDDQALIAWGAFFFRPAPDGRGWWTVDDEQLDEVEEGRTDSIGVRSQPYGSAVVEVRDGDDRVVASARTDDCNHAWVTGLEAATTYTYRVTVDGRPWGEGQLRSWHRIDGEHGELRPTDRTYQRTFTTFPDPSTAAALRAVVIGDYGVGIQSRDDSGGEQHRIAGVVERLDQVEPLDLLLTVGDNIYHQEDDAVGGSGSEDDDWYWSFYEPYRFLIDHLPLYPAVGNHDSDESEDSDDRDQLDDNHFLQLRFTPQVEAGRASVDPGLFYRFAFGRDVELVCIDTSEAGGLDADRFFTSPAHQPFLDETFDTHRSGPGRASPDGWLIPFGHHPALCAGPKHLNDPDLLAHMVPRYRHAGVRLALAGHEHNFQHAVHDDIHHIVSGAGGKLREDPPDAGFDDARTRSWAAERHVLLLEVEGGTATLWPVREVADDGTPLCVDARTPDGDPVELPIRIRR